MVPTGIMRSSIAPRAPISMLALDSALAMSFVAQGIDTSQRATADEHQRKEKLAMDTPHFKRRVARLNAAGCLLTLMRAEGFGFDTVRAHELCDSNT